MSDLKDQLLSKDKNNFQYQQDFEMMQKSRKISLHIAQQECGNGHLYQKKAIFVTFLQYLAASFIASGWPLLFENPDLFCYTDISHTNYYQCTEKEACSLKFKGSNEQQFFINRNDDQQNLTEEYNLMCKRKEWIYFSTQIFVLGGVLGALYFGYMTHTQGRLKVLHQSMGLMIIASLGSYFCFNIQLFTSMAFAIFFGFKGFNNTSQILLSEQCSENLRRMLPSILMSGWALGEIIIAVVRLYYFNWKNLQLLMMGIPLIILYFNQTTLQDSPRSLIVQRKFSEAKDALLNIAKKNNREVENFVLQEEIDHIKKINREKQLLGKSVYAQAEVDTYQREFEDFQNNLSFLSLFTYRSIRSKTWVFLYIWGFTTLSYYLTMVEQRKYIEKNLSFHLISAGVIELVSYLLYMNISLTYYRKIVIKHVLSILGVGHLLFIIIPMYSDSKIDNNIIGFFVLSILRVVTSGFINSFMYVYVSEVFPTSVRHFAYGLFSAWISTMWILAPIIGFQFDVYLPNVQPLSFIGVFLLIGVYLVRKLRETLDETGMIDQNLEDHLEEEEILIKS